MRLVSSHDPPEGDDNATPGSPPRSSRSVLDGVQSPGSGGEPHVVFGDGARVAQSDLSTGHVEEFFPAEVPGSLRLAPGIAGKRSINHVLEPGTVN